MKRIIKYIIKLFPILLLLLLICAPSFSGGFVDELSKLFKVQQKVMKARKAGVEIGDRNGTFPITYYGVFPNVTSDTITFITVSDTFHIWAKADTLFATSRSGTGYFDVSDFTVLFGAGTMEFDDIQPATNDSSSSRIGAPTNPYGIGYFIGMRLDTIRSFRDNTNIIILPRGTGITRFGDASNPGHLTTPTNDDVFIAGRLEADLAAYFDNHSYFANDIHLSTNKGLFCGAASEAGLITRRHSTFEYFMIFPSSYSGNARTITICEFNDKTTDWGYGSQTNPTLYIHSADATDLTQNIKIYHNQADGIITTMGDALRFMNDSKMDTLLIPILTTSKQGLTGYATCFVDTVGTDSVIYILDDNTRRGHAIE